MKLIRVAVLACLLFATDPGRATAQDSTSVTPKPDGGWHYVVEPYLLAPNMSGKTGVGGLTADVSLDPGDIFSHLQFGAMLFLEAHNSDWALVVDGLYMNLEQDGTTRLGDYEVGMMQSGVMFSGYRRLNPWAEMGLAFQYNKLEATIEGSGPLGTDTSAEESWIDPFVAVRLTVPRSDKWRLRLTSDVGGFGIGSEFAWQLYPEVGYRFTPLFELAGGYRAMGMDYTNGAGTDEFLYDMAIFGVQVAGKFHF